MDPNKREQVNFKTNNCKAKTLLTPDEVWNFICNFPTLPAHRKSEVGILSGSFVISFSWAWYSPCIPTASYGYGIVCTVLCTLDCLHFLPLHFTCFGQGKELTTDVVHGVSQTILLLAASKNYVVLMTVKQTSQKIPLTNPQIKLKIARLKMSMLLKYCKPNWR